MRSPFLDFALRMFQFAPGELFIALPGKMNLKKSGTEALAVKPRELHGRQLSPGLDLVSDPCL